MKLRKVQRVRMWGEAGLHDRNIGALGLRSGGSTPLPNRANWRADSVDPLWNGLAGETRGERLKRLRQGVAASSALSATPPLVTNAIRSEKQPKQQQQQQQSAGNDTVDISSAESALESVAITSGSR